MNQKEFIRKVNAKMSVRHLAKLYDQVLATTSQFSKLPGNLRYQPRTTKQEFLDAVSGVKVKFEQKSSRYFAHFPYVYRGCRDGKIHVDYESGGLALLDSGNIYSYYTIKDVDKLIDCHIIERLITSDMFFKDATAIAICI